MTTDELWSQFSVRLRGFIAKRIPSEADVDDVLQDVFARIHSGLGRLNSDDRLEAWLFRIARSAVVDHLRSGSGKHRTSDLPEELPGPDAPDSVNAEVAGWLKAMMELLSPEQREAIQLTDLEGLSQKDLAARLGISTTGAKSRVQRARARLKDVLLECCHIDLDRRGNAIAYARKSGYCDNCSCS